MGFSYCAKGSARVWEVALGQEIARMTHDARVTSVAFSPDGKYVVSGGDKTARVWEPTTGQEIARMTHDLEVTSAVFSPDGKYVLSGANDQTARLWEVGTGQEISRITHDGGVTSAVFSPDGKYVLSGGWDSTARVWDAATGQEIVRMTHGDWGDAVPFVAFSPDGKYILSGGCDIYGFTGCPKEIVRVWEWRPEDLIANACAHLPRNLTRAEWEQYIGDAMPYQAVCPNLQIEPEPTATPIAIP